MGMGSPYDSLQFKSTEFEQKEAGLFEMF